MHARCLFFYLRVALVAAFFATLPAAYAQAPAPGPNQAVFMYKGADRDTRLVEKARQEGSVSVYTSLAPTEAAPLVEAFEKKHGIKVQMWR
ncbi:MAG: ABC transporter substrate-binding protein, partial [Pseudomonadota bacterium]|nr:ABC transporter substrate-binding protein [Pseudomonadota bacterium]